MSEKICYTINAAHLQDLTGVTDCGPSETGVLPCSADRIVGFEAFRGGGC